MRRLFLLTVMFAACAGCDRPVNPRDPGAAAHPQVRWPFVGFCLDHPEVPGCESAARAVKP